MLATYSRALPGFRWQVSNVAGVRPAAAIGAVVTPGNNAKGAWVELLSAASMQHDARLVMIGATAGAVAATVRDELMDIGVDPAGGTNYSVLIPDLLVSCAQAAVFGGHGVWYLFPLRIPAGASVAARASVNNGASPGTVRAIAKMYGLPTDPGFVSGRAVRAYGVTPASSTGTLVAAGTAGEGDWVGLGAVGANDTVFWWQYGVSNNDVVGTALYYADLAIGDAQSTPTTGAKELVIEESYWATGSTNNEICKPLHNPTAYRVTRTGEKVYIRYQCSITPAAGIGGAAYGVVL